MNEGLAIAFDSQKHEKYAFRALNNIGLGETGTFLYWISHIKLIIWFSGPPACIHMVLHGQFYCHFYKIKIRTAELHYSGEKIVTGFNFRLIQSISGIKSQNKNIVEKWR
jgi:hypothetical protein